MTAKNDALAALDKNHDEFRALIDRVPQDAYEETWYGDWSVRQILAHMAGWFRTMAEAFDRVGRGERPAPEGVDLGDTEGHNARFAAEAPPADRVLAEFDGAFDVFRAAAANLSEGLYGIDPEKGRPRIGDRLIEGAGTGHFAEHIGPLREWLESR